MRDHFENASWGALDYAAYPVSKVVMAPILRRRLRRPQFRICVFASAVGNMGAVLASGFADTNIQHIALTRSGRDAIRVEQCIRTVHLGLSIPGGMCIAVPLTPVAVLASALIGRSVTGAYAMLTLGRAGSVVWTTLASGIAMLSSVGLLWRHFGVTGVATSRVLFGLASLTIYIQLYRLLNKRAAQHQSLPLLQMARAKEGL